MALRAFLWHDCFSRIPFKKHSCACTALSDHLFSDFVLFVTSIPATIVNAHGRPRPVLKLTCVAITLVSLPGSRLHAYMTIEKIRVTMDSNNKVLLKNVLLLLFLHDFASCSCRVRAIANTHLTEHALTFKASSLDSSSPLPPTTPTTPTTPTPAAPFPSKSSTFSATSSSLASSGGTGTRRRAFHEVREDAADQPAADLSLHDKDSLERLLCRHFDIVFRVTSCGHSNGKKRNTTAGATTHVVTHGSLINKSYGIGGGVYHGQSPRRDDDAEAPVTGASTGRLHRRAQRRHDIAICLWSYRLAVASKCSRRGGGGGGCGGSGSGSGDSDGGSGKGKASSNSSTPDSGSGDGEEEVAAPVAGRQRGVLRRLMSKLWPDGQTWDASTIKETRSMPLPGPLLLQPQQREQQQQQSQQQRRRRRRRQKPWRQWRGGLRLLHAEGPLLPAAAAEILETDGDDEYGSAVLTKQDLMPHNSVWPREALAYKAHLTALRLCRELLPKPPPAPKTESLLKQQPEHGAVLGEQDGTDGTALPPPPPVHPRRNWSSGGGACAIITDDVSWLAAADGGALEKALRREGSSSAAAVVAAGVAAAAATAGTKTLQRRAVFIGRDAAELNATVSTLLDPVVQSNVATRRPLLGVVPWGPRHDAFHGGGVGGGGGGGSGGGGGGGGGGSGVYTRENWLADLEDGLSNMQRQEALMAAAVAAATDTYGNLGPAVQVPLGDSGGGDGVLGFTWDAVALPSACAGWGIGGADVSGGSGAVSTEVAATAADAGADGGDYITKKGGWRKRGEGDIDNCNTEIRSSNNSHGPMGHTRVPFPPPPLYGMVGCILAFSAKAAAALDLLAARNIPPYRFTEDNFHAISNGSTAAANRINTTLPWLTATVGNCTNGKPLPSYSLLPVTNSPFFAKLNLLARQGVLSLGVATPPSRLITAAAAAVVGTTTATATDADADGATVATATGIPAPASPPPYRRRFLLFTCAGDQGIWRMWNHPERNYDLLVAYYGAMDLADPRVSCGVVSDPRVAASSGSRPDYVYRAHGSKHQNLHRLNSLYPGLLGSYEVVAVWDDDLASSAAHVSAMFERFAELMTHGPAGDPDGVWVGQPSLKYGSKVDHVLLAHQPTLRMSYTSFVENNACVFRSDKLRELLESPAYSGELMGWGVDYAYLAALGPKVQNRYVVLHDFQVLNPPSTAKAEGREILKLASQEDRIRQWESYKARFRIEVEPEVAYKCIPVRHDLPPEQYPSYCPSTGRRR
ncbi:hypothetical protein Vretimale_159 [Volvox reticuliferus]|uniref:Uncharacterized protein n=1 Tax=Volvox reticuliferus TaxID=1737510 RepID=A0A8J4D1L0_9CHLO|nr:hypothetical protein Vretimale_159 [Volvox reticuliferus]